MAFYDKQNVPTPSYIIDETALENNMKLLKHIIDSTNVKILISQKAFATYYFYSMMEKYISGTSSSGLYEARLGYEEMGNREVHVYSPAYSESDIEEIITICDHVVFNSPSQWNRYKKYIQYILKNNREIHFGIRINPEYSEVEKELYNPCAKYSRLGTTLEQFSLFYDTLFSNSSGINIDGLLFHTMSEQNVDTLRRTLSVVTEKFGKYFDEINWINFGGGHLITRESYDVNGLIELLNDFHDKYGIQTYIEPGEAIALKCGYMLCTVIDIIYNERSIAILDTSATCHMPNIIEVPFSPQIVGAGKLNEKPYNYRIAGISCLAGDIFGDYSFDYELKPGDRLQIDDMIVYSIVKNNTFNGVKLPNICAEKNGKIKIIKSFGYDDYKGRL